MRSDGKRIKAVNPMYEIVPYIMPKRYDAQNLVNIQLDEDRIRDYLREKRAAGILMDHMTVLIAAYLRTCANYPVLNRFVVNKKIYQRNHFCVCYVMLKKMPDGTMDETINKIYLDLNDDIFTVHKKIQEVVRKNAEAEYDNSMDKFIHGLLRIPVLPSFIVSVLKVMDRYGLMPRLIHEASPFHTSMFITNMASINSNYIYHHLYNFGTTSIFVSLGKLDGCEAITFTNDRTCMFNAPSEAYLDTLKRGLQENYPSMTVADIDAYLQSCIRQGSI